MADDDLDRLLADVERSLNPTGPNDAAASSGRGRLSRRGGSHPSHPEAKADTDSSRGRVGQSAVAGGVAAVGVFVAFALLPFLRAGSGAAGAFVGAFAAWLIATLVRR